MSEEINKAEYVDTGVGISAVVTGTIFMLSAWNLSVRLVGGEIVIFVVAFLLYAASMVGVFLSAKRLARLRYKTWLY